MPENIEWIDALTEDLADLYRQEKRLWKISLPSYSDRNVLYSPGDSEDSSGPTLTEVPYGRRHIHDLTQQPCPCSPMVKPLGRHVQ